MSQSFHKAQKVPKLQSLHKASKLTKVPNYFSKEDLKFVKSFRALKF